MIPNNSEHKMCTKCRKTKALEEFYEDKTHKNNKHSQCKQCRKENVAEYLKRNPGYIKEYRGKNLEKSRREGRQWRSNLRLEVITHYGGKCECCGESTLEFLALDHPNNDGAKHRKQIGKGAGAPYYSWLKQNNYPKELVRVLCHNCNSSRAFFGYCPHQKGFNGD